MEDFKGFKFKSGFIDKTGNAGTVTVKTVARLNYLGNFWRTFAILFINYEVNLFYHGQKIIEFVKQTDNFFFK